MCASSFSQDSSSLAQNSVSPLRLFLGKRKHTPPCSSAELFFAEKKWGPQRKDFGGGHGLPGFYRVFVSTTGLESFSLRPEKFSKRFSFGGGCVRFFLLCLLKQSLSKWYSARFLLVLGWGGSFPCYIGKTPVCYRGQLSGLKLDQAFQIPTSEKYSFGLGDGQVLAFFRGRLSPKPRQSIQGTVRKPHKVKSDFLETPGPLNSGVAPGKPNQRKVSS